MLRAQPRRRTMGRRLSLLAAFAVAMSTLAAMNPAVAAPSSGAPIDGAMVQFQVRPTDGNSPALADALSAEGYDVEHRWRGRDLRPRASRR